VKSQLVAVMNMLDFQRHKYPSLFLAVASVLRHCWLGGRKGIQPVKDMGDDGGGHCLVEMEWRPAGGLVCLPLSILPCTIGSRGFLLAPAHPGVPGKRAVKRLCVCVYVCF